MFLSSAVFQSCERGEDMVDVSEDSLQITREDEVSTLDGLPEHIRESLLSSSETLKRAAREGKGKKEEFGDIVPDMAIEREHENGTTSYTLGLEKLEQGLYYDNIALQEYEDGSTVPYVIRYRPSLEWLNEFFGRQDRYEHYTGTMEVYDGEGAIRSRIDLAGGELVASESFNSTTGKCELVLHSIAIGCVYTCWISNIEIGYLCDSGGDGSGSGWDGSGGGDDTGGIGGGTGGTGGSGGEPGINTTPVEDFEEELGIWHAACRSFQYEDFGGTGTKVAAVKGIEHPVLRTDSRCPGVGYVFPQSTYYFTLPSWKPRAQSESAKALERAFDKLDAYFKSIPCLPNGQANVNILAIKLEEFIKIEFTGIGGAASRYPPSLWDGEEHDYETNFGLTEPDC